MQWIFRGVLVAAVSLAFSAPAIAGSAYEWVTEDGVYSFSDDLKRVPKRYQPEAKKRTLGKLERYERWTPSDRRADGSHADRLAGNLERLRSANAEPAVVAGRGTAGKAPVRMLFRTGRNGNAIGVPVAGDGPVVVEKLRAKLPGDDATRSFTVVRQGDQVVALMVGQDNVRAIDQVSGARLLRGAEAGALYEDALR